jgi:hypothetical protein
MQRPIWSESVTQNGHHWLYPRPSFNGGMKAQKLVPDFIITHREAPPFCFEWDTDDLNGMLPEDQFGATTARATWAKVCRHSCEGSQGSWTRRVRHHLAAQPGTLHREPTPTLKLGLRAPPPP